MGAGAFLKSGVGGLVRALSARQVGIFALALVVTFAFLLLPIWNTWRFYRASEELSTEELRLQRLVGTIMHLDEVLTMSARMAAATGDSHWEERYWEYEPEVDAAIAL